MLYVLDGNFSTCLFQSLWFWNTQQHIKMSLKSFYTLQNAKTAFTKYFANVKNKPDIYVTLMYSLLLNEWFHADFDAGISIYLFKIVCLVKHTQCLWRFTNKPIFNENYFSVWKKFSFSLSSWEIYPCHFYFKKILHFDFIRLFENIQKN